MASTLEAKKRRQTRTREQQPTKHRPPGLNGRLGAQAGPFWHPSTPRRLAASRNGSDAGDWWSNWAKHLADRKSPRPPKFLAANPSALTWGISAAVQSETFQTRLDTLWAVASRPQKSPSGTAELVRDWLDAPPSKPPTLCGALECLALAYAAPSLASHLDNALWWQLCDQLYTLACDAQHLAPKWAGDGQAVLVQQLLAGELPLVLSSQLPEIQPLRELRKTASQALSEAIVELLDGEGLIHARHLSVVRPLLACWTRCRWMGRGLKKGCWSSDAETQYQWLVQQAVRFSRTDGTPILAPENEREWSSDLFTAALEIGGDASDVAATDVLLPGRVVPAGVEVHKEKLPEPSVNSEWAGLAMLATGWSKTVPRLSVAYGVDPVRIELEVRRELLLSGTWDVELLCDGTPISIAGEWEEHCYSSDESCDYLEIAVELSDQMKLERQVLLAHDDQVLYLADSVMTTADVQHQFEYKMRLPMTPNVEFVPERKTRDGVVAGKRLQAAVFPLALPEWRVDPRIGELTVEDGCLVLTHRVQGSNFCCPLFFDLKPRRSEKERTWRQLTVAESLDVQPHDVAIGYRAQSGKDQWLVYRTLSPAANRTVLGQNLSSEFFAGRFLKSGEVEEFIELETEED